MEAPVKSELPTNSLTILLEEIIFATCQLQFDSEVLPTICNSFDIQEADFQSIKRKVILKKEPFKVGFHLNNIKVANLHSARTEGNLQCSVRSGIEPLFLTHTITGLLIPQWKTHFQHTIRNFGSEQLTIDLWHETERDSKDNSFLLRSLDTLSKKVKASLRPTNSCPEKDESLTRLQTETKIKETEDENENSLSSFVSRRASMYTKENNWMVNAFVTFKRSKTSSTDGFRQNFLDINSPIPTGANSIPEEGAEPRANAPEQLKKDELIPDGNVKMKTEINVKRQLFQSNGSELSGGAPTELSGFSLVSLKENSQTEPSKSALASKRFKNSSTNSNFSQNFESQFLRKRMSMSDFDISSELWKEDAKRMRSKQGPESSSAFSTLKSLSPLTEKFILNRFKSNDREIVGSASVSIKSSFLKMNCCKWVIEENHPLLLSSTPKKKIGVVLSKPEVLVVTFDLQAEYQFTTSHAITFVTDSLKLFCKQKHEILSDETKDHENGIFLPISTHCKIILKSLAFIHNITEGKFSLAIWNCLISNSLGNEIHSKYLFYWLTKTEAAISCSYLSYTEKEREELADSLHRFINILYSKFSRLHASYGVNHNLELLYALRCLHLMTESKSMHTLMEEANFSISESWPKSVILQAIKDHASNWTDALLTEVPPDSSSDSACASSDAMTIYDSLKAPLASAIRNGERALLVVNDFLVLGEKIYEPMFKSELDESYINAIWEILRTTVVRYLEPVFLVADYLRIHYATVLELQDMQDIHVSIWILVLHLSKLQTIQKNRNSVEQLDYEFPWIFHKTFALLVQLWIDVSFLRAEETLKLELDVDTLTIGGQSRYGDGCVLSSSAVEFVDILMVFQERISRLALPEEQETVDSIIYHLRDKIASLVKVYQIKMCNLALETNDEQNTLSTQICLAMNNVKQSTFEAERLLAKLPFTKADSSSYSFHDIVSDAANYLFSKAFPRLSSRLGNIYTKCRKEHADYILCWIKSILEPSIDKMALFATTLQYFWIYLFSILENEQNSLTDPEEFKNLGNFVDSLYYFFKVNLRVNLLDSSELEFTLFMHKIEHKSCSTSELIRQYFAQRYLEQTDSSGHNQTLVVNIHFWKGKGLVADIHMGPYVNLRFPGKRRTSWVFSQSSELLDGETDKSRDSDENKNSVLSYETRETIPGEVKDTSFVKAASNKILRIIASPSKTTEFYVKVKLHPSDWFPGTKERKSKRDVRNPPVFDSQIIFKQVEAENEGIRKGGFIVFRLKISNSNISHLIGEVIFPLKEAPLVTNDDRRRVKHKYLVVSKPTKIKDYPALVELSTRKQDKTATSFLSQLENYLQFT